MMSLEQKLWHTCYRKKPFKSAEDAHTAYRKMGYGRGKNMTAYLCPVCNLWHLAKKVTNG